MAIDDAAVHCQLGGESQGTAAGLAEPGGEEAGGKAHMSNSCVKGGYSGHAEKHSR